MTHPRDGNVNHSWRAHRMSGIPFIPSTFLADATAKRPGLNKRPRLRYPSYFPYVPKAGRGVVIDPQIATVFPGSQAAGFPEMRRPIGPEGNSGFWVKNCLHTGRRTPRSIAGKCTAKG